MKILTDLHTHTNVSQHAFSTLTENAKYAAEVGMELIACTNHGPTHQTTGELGVHIWHFKNLSLVPRTVEGITVLRGAETNIMDENGTLDIENSLLAELDIVIASCHLEIFEPHNDESFKRIYTAVMDNPHVDILGHICRCKHLKYLDEIIKLAAQKNKLIEINNSCFRRSYLLENAKLVVRKCLEHKAKIVVNSDAHICYQIGDFANAIKYLKEVGYPEELIINRNKKTLTEHLSLRTKSSQFSE